MTRKLDDSAFEFYAGLGPGRSYRAVAEEFGCCKQAVVAAAKREKWQERLEERERKAREATEKAAVETLEAITRRHLASVRTVQAKALEALRTMSLDSAKDAARALLQAVQAERLIVGEPTERSSMAFEDQVKREYERWLEDAQTE